MNLNEKTQHLQEAAMTEARLQANAIIEQHRKALESVFEQHKTEATRQAEIRVKAETVNMKQQLNMAASKAQLELKREFGKTQIALKKELFDEVACLIQEYMKTNDYKELLISYIQKAVRFADGAEMVIYINPSDEDKKAYLEERTGMTLTISHEDFIGGVRSVIRAKNILIDNAFKGAIEREYQRFTFKGGTGIGK